MLQRFGEMLPAREVKFAPVDPMQLVDWMGGKAAVPVAAGAASAPWWIGELQRWSEVAGALLPFLGIAIALLTIWGKVRALRRQSEWYRLCARQRSKGGQVTAGFDLPPKGRFVPFMPGS